MIAAELPSDPDLACALLARPGHGLGGALVVAPGAEEAARWLDALRRARVAHADASRPLAWRTLPAGVDDVRLDGGIDLTATLAGGRAVHERGLLDEAAGGVLVIGRAADARPAVLARVARRLDEAAECPADAALTVVAVAWGDDERAAVPDLLADRLALHLTLPYGYAPNDALARAPERDPRRATDARGDAAQLWQVADALGVGSVRAVSLALRVTSACTALAPRPAPNASLGAAEGEGGDAAPLAAAVRLVLAPRARQAPVASHATPPADTPPGEQNGRIPLEDRAQADAQGTAEQPRPAGDSTDANDVGSDQQSLTTLLIDAARASLPADLLSPSGTAARGAGRPAAGRGRKAPAARGRGADVRGRVVGTTPGRPGGGRRLALIETLRTAAPWQRARGRTPGAPMRITPSDLRLIRRRRAPGTTTVVAVDASGSAALGRLAEAKGAVELLLASCYARRDRVALVAFRGRSAEVLLPPTRALARARRAVTALPAGGGTPLAAGLDAAAALAREAARDGARPVVVVLTDGRANVARDGRTGRDVGREDARRAAVALGELLRKAAGTAVMVDTAARGGVDARAIGDALGARYVALPHVSAAALHAGIAAAVADAPAEHGARAAGAPTRVGR